MKTKLTRRDPQENVVPITDGSTSMDFGTDSCPWHYKITVMTKPSADSLAKDINERNLQLLLEERLSDAFEKCTSLMKVARQYQNGSMVYDWYMGMGDRSLSSETLLTLGRINEIRPISFETRYNLDRTKMERVDTPQNITSNLT